MHKFKLILPLAAIGLILLAFLSTRAPVSAPALRSTHVKMNKVSEPAQKTAESAKTTEGVVEKLNPAWVAREGERMNRLDANPEQTLARMKALAQRMTSDERELLVRTVTNAEASENERILSLQLLTLCDQTSNEDYYRIAKIHELPSGNEFHDRFVEVLAIAGLEQIQNRALENPSLRGDLQRLSQHSQNASVRKMACEMLNAVNQGRLITAEVQ